ncbi:hypothetical protein [Thermosipho atlanticus]|nr:hypothetical protein [Thermosipho atlanticus]
MMGRNSPIMDLKNTAKNLKIEKFASYRIGKEYKIFSVKINKGKNRKIIVVGIVHNKELIGK